MIYIWFICRWYMINIWIISGYGWWLTYPSEKYEVSWVDYFHYMEKQMFHTTNQNMVKIWG